MKTSHLLCFLALFIFSCQPKNLINTNREAFSETDKTDMDNFLQSAIETGMDADGFPQDLAENILRTNDLWVAKCPICMAVQRGIKNYIAPESRIFHKSYIKKKVLSDLSSTEPNTQKTALKSLIDRYVQQHYQTLKMTEAETTNMKVLLEAGRKTGMGRMGNNNGKFCASCDGACAKP